jgi:hypothetical protein
LFATLARLFATLARLLATLARPFATLARLLATLARRATYPPARRRDFLLGNLCTLFVAIINPINKFFAFMTDGEARTIRFAQVSRGIRKSCHHPTVAACHTKHATGH